ncbi:hypothetical protein BC826DRAFT_1013743 [Russula brevipes]|nr:hypothetical protein BC826DRAFT_1013743 [Russula brevipes]
MDTAIFARPTATSDSPPPAPTSTSSMTSAQPETPPDREGEEDLSGDAKKRASKAAKRRKVNHACLYCRRSHMTCDEGRPCQRCIKREIGHLCHDENKPGKQTGAQPQTAMPPPATLVSATGMSKSFLVHASPCAWCRLSFLRATEYVWRPCLKFVIGAVVCDPDPDADGILTHIATATPYAGSAVATPPAPSWPGLAASQSAYVYPLETFGREFSSLSDFLETLDEQAFFTGTTVNGPDTFGNTVLDVSGAIPPPTPNGNDSSRPESSTLPGQQAHPQVNDLLHRYVDLVPPVLPSASLAEKFLLTAADPAPGTRDERLKRVIRTKYEAGLLKPYNYVKGYARLSRWMDCNVSQESKQQILQPLSVLRPKFRAIAQSLRDMDLVFIEEAFERLMLDYDRVFSCMGIPACLWRRTGEIYKGNREFAELVGVEGYMLRDGRLCIYELMAEESAVNYWEKYGNVAFDSTQKAVLTSCVLRFKPAVKQGSGAPTPGRVVLGTTPSEEGFISCCFSFTIRRDTWGIPLMIVGNFIRC